jgi:hypothetical protein
LALKKEGGRFRDTMGGTATNNKVMSRVEISSEVV